MRSLIDRYAKFVGHHPYFVIICFALISVLMFVGVQNLETQDLDYQDMLPENYDAIFAFELINEEFGSTSSGNIVLFLDKEYVGSNEVQFISDPDVVKYSYVLESYFSQLQGIEDVQGIGELVVDEFGFVPNSISEVREVSKISGTSFVSEDESFALIRLTLSEDVSAEMITEEVQEILEGVEKPEGVDVGLTGEVFEDTVIENTIGPDMNKTSMFSILAIVLILAILFRSVKGVFFPLLTIIFGVLWTMGFLGLMGSGLSSMTSGAISMIMGIGIDFGIQVMSRFNFELKSSGKNVAMERTLKGVLLPILTTAFACLIGFQAMGWGELTLMAEMGKVMSYGVLFCMVAAVSVVPSLLVVFTRKGRKKK